MRNGNLSFYILALTLLLLSLDLSAQNGFNRIYGGPGGEEASAVIQTYDGGYIFAGSTTSYGAGYDDIWLVKLKPDGDTLWTKSYGFELVEGACSIKQTADSGYIVLGRTTSSSEGLYVDFWLLRTDQTGDTIWTKFYGNLWEQETPAEVITTLDGGFALVGKGPNYGGDRAVWLIKTNSNGDTSWTQKYGGPYGEAPTCIIQTSDSGFLIGGCISMSGSLSDQDFYIIKTDVLGDTVWTRIVDNANSDCVMSVTETPYGGYLIAGHTDHYYYGFSFDIWLLKLNSDGNSLWSKFYGSYEDEYARSIHPSGDGGFVISGSIPYNNSTTDGMLLIKINAAGDTAWTRRFGAEGIDAGTDAYPAMDGGFILSGSTSSYGALNRDAWIIKTNEFGYITSVLSDEPNLPRRSQLYQNYPNPFNPTTTINYELPITNYVDLSVYNLLGQRVALLVSEKQASGRYSVDWDASDFSSGMYFYRLKVGNDYSELKKMLLLK